MHSTNTAASESKSQALVEEFMRILAFVQTAYETGSTAHEVELGLWERVLRLAGQLYQAFLASCGDGDAGERISLDDGRELRRLTALHRREIQNVFGTFALDRVVYGTREGQKIEAVPLDRRLALPQEKHSYLLQEWGQALAVEMPYALVGKTLERILGLPQSVHTLERNQRALAASTAPFWQAQPTPPAAQEGAIVVASADGKGVPMRGAAPAPAGIEPPSTSADQRPGGKKMALLGAIYTIEPFVRTPEEVLEALFRDAPSEPPPARPKPCHKAVRAALQRDAMDSTEPQVNVIFDWMATQVSQRNPAGSKPMVLIMDGQTSLWNAGQAYLREQHGEVTEVLDLLHALGYLWDAASLFYPNNATAARAWVKQQARRLLHGEVASVIHALHWLGTHHQLRGKRRATLKRVCGYFHNNAHRMAYDVYLEHGFPIASGVIEGACRCVVKDRMERSGMRWVMPGASAMLDMRCIHLSNRWDAFMDFHRQHEFHRLYPGSAANEDDFRQPLAA